MPGNKNSGRKTLPAEVKRLQGSLNVTREKGNGAEVDVKRVTSFAQCKKVNGLESLSERALKIYRDTCNYLIEMKVMTRGDLPNVLIYAQQYDLYLSSWKDLEKGYYWPLRDNKSGQIIKFVRNPGFATMNSALTMIAKYGALLGLSPSDRQRLHPEGEDKKAPDVLNIIMNSNYEPDDQ